MAKKKATKKKAKAKANQIQVPREVLENALAFGSLYGSTTQDRTKHAQIPTLKLLFEDGSVKAFGKRKDALCVFTFTLFNDDIKGSGEILIGDVIKLIGGRDINENRFTGVIKRLGDIVTIDIVSNQVIFDKDKDFDVSISLIDSKVADDYVIDESEFPKKINFDGTVVSEAYGSKLSNKVTLHGNYLKEIMEDEKTTTTEWLKFDMAKDEKFFRMKLGNAERSMRRKIPYENKGMSEDFDSQVYNGLEAFAQALDDEESIDIYEIKDKALIFVQSTPEHQLLLVSGVKR